MQLGLRDANQHFSKAIKAVKAGKEVILTERGKPIAVIKPLPEPTAGDDGLRRLVASGIVRPAAKPWPMPRRRPHRIKGPPLSQTIREDREID
jgi:prevent-host-death family protein